MNNWKTLEDVERTLDSVVCGKLCVQVWVSSIGNDLFIGFGDEVMAPVPRGGKHDKPPYEIETDFADWWIQDNSDILITSNSKNEDAQAAAEILIGKKVVNWCFLNESPALRIVFEDGLELRMAPYSDGRLEYDAWVLRGPIYYGYMRWDGIIGNGRCDHYFVDE